MKLASEVIGAGPPLCLVHGWGLGPQAWTDVSALLATSFRVHNFALPGYRGSAEANGAGLTDLADALAASLPDEATLCGWSLGAMIAVSCAARHSGRVKRLALVGTNGRFVANTHWPQALPEAQLDGFARDLEADAARLLQRFTSLLNHGDRREREATRDLRRCLAGGLPADPATLRAGLEALRRADIAADAVRVTQPVLILHGSEDPLVPLSGAQRLTALFGNARLHVMEGCAHAPFVSQAQAFAARLGAFAATAP